jgi:hypothetical protein
MRARFAWEAIDRGLAAVGRSAILSILRGIVRASAPRQSQRCSTSALVNSERAVRRFTDCTPSYYRFWAVADAKTDRCLGMVNYHDGHIRNKRVSAKLAQAQAAG